MTDLAGRVFARWTVLCPAGCDFYGKTMWRCRCSCGTERSVHAASLTTGKSRSCGCLRAEVAAKTAERMWSEWRRAKREAM